MIQFKTKNSEYRVQVMAGKFHVTKLAAMNPESTFAAVGQTRISNRMRLEIGDRANFDGWYTSEVVSIQDSPPIKEGTC